MVAIARTERYDHQPTLPFEDSGVPLVEQRERQIVSPCVPALGHCSVETEPFVLPTHIEERHTAVPKSVNEFVEGLSADEQSVVRAIITNLTTAQENSQKRPKATKAAATAARNSYVGALKKFVGVEDERDLAFVSWRHWLRTHGMAISAALDAAASEQTGERDLTDLGISWRE